AGAATGVISVNASNSACPWTAAGNGDWIVVSSGASGMGSGSVQINIGANSGASRSSTITIAGQPFTVNQAGADCTVSLSGGDAGFSAGGGTGSVDVTTPGHCAYSTLTGPSWITITAGGTGVGSSTVNFSVAANSSTQLRSGFLVIGGQPFQVSQSG